MTPQTKPTAYAKWITVAAIGNIKPTNVFVFIATHTPDAMSARTYTDGSAAATTRHQPGKWRPTTKAIGMREKNAIGTI